MSNICNILLIGETGAGKSSFGNYLLGLGKDVFKKGNGAPVTKFNQQFQSYTFDYGNIKMNVLDTMGFEQSNSSRLIESIEKLIIESKDNKNDTSKIIHGIFFVINGSNERVENFEMSLIDRLRKIWSPLQIIVSHIDIINQEKFAIIKNEILSKYKTVSVHGVCAVESEKRDGTKSKMIGKEEVLTRFIVNSYDYVGKWLVYNLITEMRTIFDDCKRKAISRIKNSDISIFNMDAMDNFEVDDLMPNEEFMERKMGYLLSYKEFIDQFDIDVPEKDHFNKLMDKFESYVDEMRSAKMDKLENAMSNLENGNIFEKIGGFIKMAGTALNLKGTLVEVIEDVFREIDCKLYRFREDLKLQR